MTTNITAHRAHVVTEVEHLLASGEWPERIAHRLGYGSSAYLVTMLRRWGHTDLAHRVRAVEVATA